MSLWQTCMHPEVGLEWQVLTLTPNPNAKNVKNTPLWPKLDIAQFEID